jgi:hypothetical protein
MVQSLRACAFAASLALLSSAGFAQAQSASADDTARFLAGLQPSAGSPLAALTKDRTWQHHADRFNSVFGRVENQQLTRIRAWSKAKLTSPSPVLFYMFSGPDFLYANAFFPDASTYVMAGLEPTGPIPDLTRLSRDSVDHALGGIEGSLRSILAYSFFQTKEMRHELVATRVSGTLPILYLFLARSGKTIRDVSLIRLDADGNPQPDDGSGSGPRGAKIVFAGADGRERTLYYFSTNVANDGFKVSGFARFCERLGSGDGFVKSASYLMHDNHFSDVRNFLLTHTHTLLQDDSGVPVAYFDLGKWQLKPFGHYSGPISIFANKYQSKLSHMFGRGGAESINFGVGYHWRPQSSNLLVATRTDAAVGDVVASTQPDAVVRDAQSTEQPAAAAGRASSGAQERKSTARKHAHGTREVRTTHRRQRSYAGYPGSWHFWFPR